MAHGLQAVSAHRKHVSSNGSWLRHKQAAGHLQQTHETQYSVLNPETKTGQTEQTSILCRCLDRLSAGTQPILSLPKQMRQSRLGDDRFLPNPFQFIKHPIIPHNTAYTLTASNISHKKNKIITYYMKLSPS
jgi:hypothetical protein